MLAAILAWVQGLNLTGSEFFHINIGNVITWCTLLGCVFAGWQKIRDRLERQDERLAIIEREFGSVLRTGVPTLCALHADRLGKMEKKLDALAEDIAWIKGVLLTKKDN